MSNERMCKDCLEDYPDCICKNMGDAFTREDGGSVRADNECPATSPATACKSCEGLVKALEIIASSKVRTGGGDLVDKATISEFMRETAKQAISEHRKSMESK